MATLSFFNGAFFGGEFFNIPQAPNGKGDNGKKERKRNIIKPTGLLARKKVILPEVAPPKIVEPQKFADGYPGEVELKPVAQMSMIEMDFEIKALMHKQYRTQEEEAMLLIMIAANL